MSEVRIELLAAIRQLLELLRLNELGKKELFALLHELLQKEGNTHSQWLQEKFDIFLLQKEFSEEEFFKKVYESIQSFPTSGYHDFNEFFEMNLLRLKLGLRPKLMEQQIGEHELEVDLEKFLEFSTANRRKNERSNVWIENIQLLSSDNYKKLNRLRVLSFEECKGLSIAIKDGIELSAVNENIGVDLLAVDETPMDIFITHNLRLVRNLALKASLSSPLVEIEDLFQMGVFGLVRAIEKWDWSLGYKFSTYAVWWIRQSINRLSIDSDQLIRIPVHARESHISKRNALVKKYELGNEMSILSGLSKNTYEDADWLETFVFENTFMGHESLTGLRYQTGEIRVKHNIPNIMPNYLWDPAYQYEQYELKERLAWVLDTLSEREAEVIILRYGLTDGTPKTLDEIGKVYGVTRERIRQIESKVMSKLRHPARSDVLRDFLD